MPGRILGFDFGRTSQSASELLRPIAERKRSPSAVRSGAESRRDSMDHFKRPSLAAAHKHHSNEKKEKHSSARNSPRIAPVQKHFRLDMLVESPPALLIDDPQRSSGALYSCKLRLHVVDKPVTLSTFHLIFRVTTSTKRPVQEHCKECMARSNDLKDWKFLSEPTTFAPGVHEFPASYLIPGHLPATTHGHIGSIDYELYSKAVSSKGEDAEFTKPLLITRAIRPGAEKSSVRIFPPTNLTLNVTLPSVIHPIGDFPVYARMSGVTVKKDDSQTRWRLRKLTWRIEEHETMVSPACPKHAIKVGGEGKGVAHEHSREIGSEELKTGWKSDFQDGEIEGEFTASIDSGLRPNACVESPSGLKIKHVLVLELVIAEEWAPNKKPQQSTPTGAARVLRTQFNIAVTERSGMGIAWDDEQPPLYEDVPGSPPAYLRVDDYHGDDLNEDVEHLHLGH